MRFLWINDLQRRDGGISSIVGTKLQYPLSIISSRFFNLEPCFSSLNMECDCPLIHKSKAPRSNDVIIERVHMYLCCRSLIVKPLFTVQMSIIQFYWPVHKPLNSSLLTLARQVLIYNSCTYCETE